MTLLFELIGVAVLIVLNAFFVAAEYGLVTARRTRIIELQHQGNRRARDVLRITGDPGRFIAAMQLGVTLTSLGIGALGEQTLSNEFDKWMSTLLAIVLAFVNRSPHPDQRKCVWIGTGAALAIAVAVGLVLHLTIDGLEGEARLRTFAAICLAAAGQEV